MDPAGDSCYNCRRPLREIDFRQGRAIRVGSLASCERCAEPLLSRLTPEQRASIFRKLEGEPPPEDDGSVEVLPPEAEAPAHATSHSLRRPAVRPASAVPPSPPAAPGRKVLWISLAAAGAVLLVLVFALAGGPGRKPEETAGRGPAGSTRRDAARDPAPSPATPDRRADEETRRKEALQADIAALDREIRAKSDAQEYQKALDALEAARPRRDAAPWSQAVDRLAREVRDAAGGHFVRLKPKLADALEQGDRAEVKRIRDDVARWGMPSYAGELEQVVAAATARVNEGLACWLKLDEASGRTAADASGGGRAGTLQGGCEWRPSGGRIGGAIAFNGRDACVVIPRPVQDDLTIAFWMKTTQAWVGNQWYEGAGLVDGECHGTGSDFGTALVQGRFAFGCGGRYDKTVASTRPVNDGAWRHAAATRIRSSGMVRVFVDGAPAGSGTCDTPSFTGPTRMTIGCIQTGISYYDGLIDDVRIYSRALSTSEVGALADAAGPAPAGAAAPAPGDAPAAAPGAPPAALTEAEKAAGWRLLFDGRTMTGWRRYKGTGMPSEWAVENGALVLLRGGPDIVFEEPFGDFELTLEWRTPQRGDSGIIYRVVETEAPPWMSGPEMQVASHESSGGIPELFPPARSAAGPPGQWNRVRILAKGPKVEHWLNNGKVCAFEIGDDDWKARVARSKFGSNPRFALSPSGRICLQGQTPRVEYRDIRIRVLP